MVLHGEVESENCGRFFPQNFGVCVGTDPLGTCHCRTGSSEQILSFYREVCLNHWNSPAKSTSEYTATSYDLLVKLFLIPFI